MGVGAPNSHMSKGQLYFFLLIKYKILIKRNPELKYSFIKHTLNYLQQMIIEFLLLLWVSRRVRHSLAFNDLQDQWWNKTSTTIE